MCMKVYIVIQHQEEAPEYDNRIVYVCATESIAEYAAAKLNREYAEHAVLDDDGLFVDVEDGKEEYSHYYTVDSYAVEESVADIDQYN